jgi:hypothetical protein
MLDVLFEMALHEPRLAALAHGSVIGGDGLGNAANLASGLRWAASLRPSVVAVPLCLTGDHPLVWAGVGDVLRTGAVLLAAVGNPFASQRRALYPAAYPGVIAVGASAYAATYSTWAAPPDEVPVDFPERARDLGTSGACMVASWRRLQEGRIDGGYRIDQAHTKSAGGSVPCSARRLR